MAKRKSRSMSDIFSKTQQPEATEEGGKRDIISTRGVGLKESEWAELEKMGKENNLTLHAITTYGIRYFMKAYRDGKIKPETKKTQTLPGL